MSAMHPLSDRVAVFCGNRGECMVALIVRGLVPAILDCGQD